MNSQLLNANNFYSEGSQLWFLEQNPKSNLFQKIDWYCHFLLNKSIDHKSKKPLEKIEKILLKSNLNLQFEEPSNKHKPSILIPSKKWIPCDWLILLPEFEENLWVDQIQNQSKNLKMFKIRIFVKTTEQATRLKQKLKLEIDSQLSFVIES